MPRNLQSRPLARAGAVLAVLAATATTAATTAPAASAAVAPHDVRPAAAPAPATPGAVLPDSVGPRPTTPPDLLAVTGEDHGLYVQIGGDGNWMDLGGSLRSAPVMAFGWGDLYFVAAGRDSVPYIRSFEQGWRRLGPAGVACADPAVTTDEDTLSVACRGADGHLLIGKAAIPERGLPHVTRFTDRGGDLRYGGLAGIEQDGSAYYEGVGRDHVVYATSDKGGLTPASETLRCYGSVSQDALGEGGAACRAQDATLQVSANDAADADGFTTLRGSTVGRPGVAVDDDGTSRYYVLGTGGRIYRAGQAAGGALTGFTRIGGRGLYGLTAASLAPSMAASAAQGALRSLHR